MWFKKRCDHKNVRCIHGDEILTTTRWFRRPSFARVRCLEAGCGKPLYHRDFPEVCWWTDQPHNYIQRRRDL